MLQGGFEVNLECFLWDLVDEGIEDALDRIKGETGVTGVVVPVHGRGVMQFRPHAGVSPRSYIYDGGAMFQPEPVRYGGTRIRPVVAETLRKSNPLKAVVEACHARGLKIGCGLAACYCRPVAERYEHAAVRDIFGDRDYWLCPVNPDVQEYVRSLLTDLTENYTFDSVWLSHVGFACSSKTLLWTRGHEHRGFVMGPVELWLRTICFCESCRQLSKRDGIDVEAAAKTAGETLETACRSGTCVQDPLSEFVEKNEALGAYLDWRKTQLHRWIPTLKTACRCTLIGEDYQQSLRSGLSLRELPDAYDILHCFCPETGADAVQAAMARIDGVWDRSKVAIGLSARVECPSSEALVGAVLRAAQSGCRAVSIGDYGSIPLERLEWIRQAVRFARRESL